MFDDLMTLAILDIDNESNAAAVVLVTRVIKPLRGGQGRHVHVALPIPDSWCCWMRIGTRSGASDRSRRRWVIQNATPSTTKWLFRLRFLWSVNTFLGAFQALTLRTLRWLQHVARRLRVFSPSSTIEIGRYSLIQACGNPRRGPRLSAAGARKIPCANCHVGASHLVAAKWLQPPAPCRAQ